MKMRIVGMICDEMWIQIYENGTWMQKELTTTEFTNFMKKYFPTVLNQLGDDWDAYYNYGETDEMRRKGEAYIFESEEK